MRMTFLGRLAITTLTILAIPYVITGVQVDGVYTAFFAALLLLFFNVTLKPLLIVLTLPLTVLSLGFFLFVVNGIVFGLMASFMPGIHVAGFGAAFAAALLVSAVSWLVNLGTANQDGRRIVVLRQGGGFRAGFPPGFPGGTPPGGGDRGPSGNRMRDLN